ncbi:MFS transporter, DHA1 family, multidrug resistance protein, partial [Tremellales sp. Uapishka_1]
MPHTIDLSSLAYLASTQPQSSAYPYQSHSHSATPDRAGTSTTGYSHAPYQFQPHLVPEDFNYQSPFSSAYNHASSSTASQRDIAPVQELNITGWSGVDGMEVAERTGPDPFQPWERPAVSLVTGDRFQQLLEAKLNLDSQLPQQSLAFPSQPPVFPIPQPFATPSNIPQRLNQRALDTALYDPSQVHIPPDLVAPLPPQFAWQDRSLTRDISETASPRQSRGWTAPQHDTPFMANSSAPMPNDFSIDVYPNLLPPQAPLHNPLPMPDAYLQPLAMISSSSASSLPSPKLKASPLGFPWPPTTAAQQPQHSYPLPADPLPPPLKIRVHESPVYDVESSRPTLNPVEQKDPSSVVPETLGAWGVGTFPTNMYTSGDVSWSTAAFPIDPALMDPPPPPLPTLADVWETPNPLLLGDPVGRMSRKGMTSTPPTSPGPIDPSVPLEKRGSDSTLTPGESQSPKSVAAAGTSEKETVAHPKTTSQVGRQPSTISRQMSRPPAVSPWGGVAPDGPDAENGLRATRSYREQEQRDEEREKKGPDIWAVKFEPGEKINPKNWSQGYRWMLTSLAGLFVLNSTFASSAPSGIVTDMQRQFHFGDEVAVLTISLFVAGYCVGPLLWGPLSESFGRRPIFIIAFAVYTGMQVGCALAPNTAAILIFRFLGGIFASSPLTNSGALIADMWDGDHRGQAMSLFALAPFAGPSVGPIVSGFIQVSGTDWRWVYWVLTIFAGVCLIVIVLVLPETYAPVILVKKAKKLRKETGEERWYAPLEKTDHSLKARLNDILVRPFVMLALEPMLMAVTVYMSFVYGVVYLLFEAYPFVFVENHGFNVGEEGLMFLAFFVGGAISVVLFLVIIEPRYQRHSKKVAPEMPRPEKRLELCIIAGWCMVVALFWFGWTSYASISWVSPMLAGGLLGVAILGIFVSLFNYVIDVYLWSAATALAGTTVCRSVFGAVFPLFANQMFEALGTQWASSLLGFIALILAPIPMVLSYYGPTLRSKSKFSPNKPT